MYYFLFHTIHDVLKAEKVLKGKGFAHELVPVPRALSSDCGACIRSEKDGVEIMHLLAGMNVDKCFLFEGNQFTSLKLEEG
jgi:Putative Se/S carrier protein-like